MEAVDAALRRSCVSFAGIPIGFNGAYGLVGFTGLIGLIELI